MRVVVRGGCSSCGAASIKEQRAARRSVTSLRPCYCEKFMLTAELAVVVRHTTSKVGRGSVAGVLAGVVALAAVGTAQAGDRYNPNSTTATLLTTVGSTVDGVNNYTHVEGPIYDGNGGILFCELNHSYANDLIWRWDIAAKTKTKIVASSGGTEGEYYTTDGRMITADRDTRRISIRTVSPISDLYITTTSADTYGGKQFNGPNDVVVSSAGRIYFTDPNFENFSNRQSVDGVYTISAITNGTVYQSLTYGSSCPNGIILSPDESKLYVGVYYSNAIYSYDLDSNGLPISSSKQTIATLTHPDGMTIDRWGNIIATRQSGVTCYSPTGTSLWTVSTAESAASNVEIYNNTLYITAGMSLYSVGLTPTPEPASLGILGTGMALLLVRRRRR
jgi:gluconolactonase